MIKLSIPRRIVAGELKVILQTIINFQLNRLQSAVGWTIWS